MNFTFHLQLLQYLSTFGRQRVVIYPFLLSLWLYYFWKCSQRSDKDIHLDLLDICVLPVNTNMSVFQYFWYSTNDKQCTYSVPNTNQPYKAKPHKRQRLSAIASDSYSHVEPMEFRKFCKMFSKGLSHKLKLFHRLGSWDL